jgi:acyl-coenzyme A thioesterase PaaI-like protein
MPVKRYNDSVRGSLEGSTETTMNVIEIPFNALLGIRQAPCDSGMLLELNESPSFLNHLGTVHAGVQLSLAEASSGEFLLRVLPGFADQVVAVVRRVEAKFKNPMKGRLSARAATAESELGQSAEPLATRGRAILPVTIEVLDQAGLVGLTATFQWFAQRRPDS